MSIRELTPGRCHKKRGKFR